MDAVAKTEYSVLVKRWEHGWELHIDGVGVTQARQLSEAEEMVRDYIALDFGVPSDSFDVTFRGVMALQVSQPTAVYEREILDHRAKRRAERSRVTE